MRATLGFLEKMTRDPEALTPADAEAVLEGGVSREALIDAVHVCALFSMIVRLADSLGWDIPPPEAFAARGRVLFESGYRLRSADEIRAL
jgi:hypothetical protein